MIVRDEEANLPRVIGSIRGLADEIVVVDTGSTDRTVEVAASLGARVDRFAWRDDFAAARNRSLALARGAWVLVLDGDDEFEREDVPRAREVVERTILIGITACQSVTYPGGASFERDHLILVRNRADLRYRFRVHERILVDPAQVERTTLRMRHHGYTPENFPAKLERNRRLLEMMKSDGEPLARVAGACYLGMHYEQAGRPDLALGEYGEAAGSGLACEYRLYAVLHLARLSAARRDRRQAQSLYRVILEANPGAVEPSLGMAELCVGEGRLGEAAEHYRAALASKLRILPYVNAAWEAEVRGRLARMLGA
jgi:glycosyltransferase involved in cell wall biosynthesis